MNAKREQSKSVIDFFDGTIRDLCAKAQERGNIHPPYRVEFIDPTNEQKIFSAPVNMIEGEPEWNKNYPHFDGRLIVNLLDGGLLTRTIDVQGLKTMNAWESAISQLCHRVETDLSGSTYRLEILDRETPCFTTEVRKTGKQFQWADHNYPTDLTGEITVRFIDHDGDVIQTTVNADEVEETTGKGQAIGA